jgi:hypothetical protein
MNTKLLRLRTYLFARQNSKMRWVYLVAGIPFISFAIAGYHYDAFFTYLIPALLCLLQYYYPTIFGWIVFVLVYSLGSCGYLFLLIKDIIRYVEGKRTEILIDFGDSLVFISLLLLILIITFLLFRVFPPRDK